MAVNGVCPFILTRKLVFHTLLTLVLILASATQGAILNLFFITAAPNDTRPYFWFLADFLVVMIFALTMLRSYSHWKKSDEQLVKRKSYAKHSESAKQQSIFKRYQYILGYHPLGYISWMFYSFFLIMKIAMIFKFEIVNQLSEESFLTPQVMKMAIALTALVFFVFVEGHYDAARHSMRALYIANLVKNYTFEIFDAITFLSLLFVSETKMVFSFAFENTIISFGCITLLLPNICLYKLSQNDYGRVRSSTILAFIYTMLHLFLVNIPYMCVRIYLWVMMREPVSIFLVKNVLNILLTLLESTSDFPELRVAVLHKLGYAARQPENSECSQSDDTNTLNKSSTQQDDEHIELPQNGTLPHRAKTNARTSAEQSV
ncbi:uncharacterized protein LOC108681419 [Hyalella azteca]|uniref:Uncharacterized protein LOC108681419 n=1 Tax=Hyalella azteca TaxID=294128 RepID=A0A8B7PKN1_HYAAZ|nr:uncharacterized protein LOC108681419 [Hyalella azteca]XP_018025931.1 uncharacterized protein LOC108681419 [Hyalella azteca]